jgi:arylsulfatase A-like enzyme
LSKSRLPFAAVTRRVTFACAVIAFAFTTCAVSAGAQAPAARPPNIILIVAVDLGYGHLGCYGQRKIATPHIDRLAAEGMRFTQFYSGGTVCAPSRSVLMTGLHTGRTPIRKNGGGAPLRDADVTMAEVLKSAGYATGGFGKWGLGTEDTTGAPTRQGFDEFFGYLHQVHAHFFYPYWLSDNGKPFMLPENEGGKRGKYSHDVILARGLDFIRRSKDEPFFCYLPFTLPHVELAVPGDSERPYRGKFPEVPIGDRPGYITSDAPRATFAGMVSRMDDGVGKVVALVGELGLAENTLIVFVSDNGGQGDKWQPLVEFFEGNGPLRGTKGALYEGGIRVPLIARWPGRIKPGTTSDRLSGHQDLLPTFAEAAGASAHDHLYWEHYTGKGMVQAVRAGDWKLVQSKPGQPFELYDLAKDLGETRDLAAEHPDVVKRLTELASKSHTPERRDLRVEKPVTIKDYVR